MCYATLYTWLKCGHFHQRHDMCKEAAARTPPTFCRTAHEPAFCDIAEDDGVCPDPAKHSSGSGGLHSSPWEAEFGSIETSGIGNQWYRDEMQKNAQT